VFAHSLFGDVASFVWKSPGTSVSLEMLVDLKSANGDFLNETTDGWAPSEEESTVNMFTWCYKLVIAKANVDFPRRLAYLSQGVEFRPKAT
jgi:hypothetical protein